MEHTGSQWQRLAGNHRTHLLSHTRHSHRAGPDTCRHRKDEEPGKVDEAFAKLPDWTYHDTIIAVRPGIRATPARSGIASGRSKWLTVKKEGTRTSWAVRGLLLNTLCVEARKASYYFFFPTVILDLTLDSSPQ